MAHGAIFTYMIQYVKLKQNSYNIYFKVIIHHTAYFENKINANAIDGKTIVHWLYAEYVTIDFKRGCIL